jgi:hypothetical protein
MRPAMAAVINFTFMEFFPSLVRQQISFLPDRGESYRTESVWCKGNCCVTPQKDCQNNLSKLHGAERFLSVYFLPLRTLKEVRGKYG